MACYLFNAKPLLEQMLAYGSFNPCEQTEVKFESR